MKQEHHVPLTVTDVPGRFQPSGVNSSVIAMRDEYTYDPLNRLTKVVGKQVKLDATEQTIYNQSFSYDKFGNRKIDLSNTWGNAINNVVYNPLPQTNRLRELTYDAAGNVASESTSTSSDRVYDAENRMTKTDGGNPSYYVYDGEGRRVRRIVGGVEYWQVYGVDGELVATYPVGGVASTTHEEYGYRGGQMLIVAACSGLKWLVADHLSTPRLEIDATGSLSAVKRHDYLPFGEELFLGVGGDATAKPALASIRTPEMGYLGSTTLNCVRQHFGVYERDAETGLDYARSRYYSSVIGRFTSPDESQEKYEGADGRLMVFPSNAATLDITINDLLLTIEYSPQDGFVVSRIEKTEDAWNPNMCVTFGKDEFNEAKNCLLSFIKMEKS